MKDESRLQSYTTGCGGGEDVKGEWTFLSKGRLALAQQTNTVLYSRSFSGLVASGQWW